MDVTEAIRKRRSIRNYKPDEIPEDVLDRLLSAMRLAPSGGNRQPWKFIVVQDREIKAKLAAACRFVPGRTSGQEFIAEAPVVVVACGSEGRATARYYKDNQLNLNFGRNIAEEVKKDTGGYLSTFTMDLAIALDHLALTAVEEGLGTCWVAGLDERMVKELLSVPDDLRVILVMPVGYPVSWPEPRPRKPLEEIICYDGYSQPPRSESSR